MIDISNNTNNTTTTNNNNIIIIIIIIIIFLIYFIGEFTKRIGDDFPVYHWTANERYKEWEEELPSFNEAPDVSDNIDAAEHPLRLHRLTLSRREDSSIFTAGRSFLPARNQTTILQRLYRPEGQLPPKL